MRTSNTFFIKILAALAVLGILLAAFSGCAQKKEQLSGMYITTKCYYLDPDSVPALMENGKTRLIGAKDVKAECDALGLTEKLTFISVGDRVTDGDFTVTAMPCDHGELAPDALGLLIEIGGKRIYSMGDTCYRPDLLIDPRLQDLDLLILPINGAFGNLNEEEAARVIATLKPKLAIPCHVWNFAEHGGNPGLFQEKMKEIAPDRAYTLMRQGEGIIL